MTRTCNYFFVSYAAKSKMSAWILLVQNYKTEKCGCPHENHRCRCIHSEARNFPSQANAWFKAPCFTSRAKGPSSLHHSSVPRLNPRLRVYLSSLSLSPCYTYRSSFSTCFSLRLFCEREKRETLSLSLSGRTHARDRTRHRGDQWRNHRTLTDVNISVLTLLLRY